MFSTVCVSIVYAYIWTRHLNFQSFFFYFCRATTQALTWTLKQRKAKAKDSSKGPSSHPGTHLRRDAARKSRSTTTRKRSCLRSGHPRPEVAPPATKKASTSTTCPRSTPTKPRHPREKTGARLSCPKPTGTQPSTRPRRSTSGWANVDRHPTTTKSKNQLQTHEFLRHQPISPLPLFLISVGSFFDFWAPDLDVTNSLGIRDHIQKYLQLPPLQSPNIECSWCAWLLWLIYWSENHKWRFEIKICAVSLFLYQLVEIFILEYTSNSNHGISDQKFSWYQLSGSI